MLPALLPPALFPADSTTDFEKAANVRTSGRLFSLVAVGHSVATDRFTIQVAQDRTADERFMRQFAALLAVVLGLGVAASAIIAWTVTQRGLRPIGEMTRALQRVGPKQLHERVTAIGWPRELRGLLAALLGV